MIKSEGYGNRVAIIKESGSSVETNSFLNPEYSILAGILYTSAKLVEMPNLSNRNIIFIHNPMASAPCDLGWFGAGKEYFVEDKKSYD